MFLNCSVERQRGLPSRGPWWDLGGRGVLFLTPALHLVRLSVCLSGLPHVKQQLWPSVLGDQTSSSIDEKRMRPGVRIKS